MLLFSSEECDGIMTLSVVGSVGDMSYVRSCSTYLSHDIQWCVPSDTPHSSDESSLTLGMSRKYSAQVCPERKAAGGGKGQRQRVWIRDDKFLPESRKRNFRRSYGSKLAGKL